MKFVPTSFVLIMSAWTRLEFSTTFSPKEQVRSFFMTPQKTLLLGTNQGNLHSYHFSTQQHSVQNMDKHFPIYHIDSSLFLTRLQTKSDTEILLDTVSQKIAKSFVWPNISTAQVLTSSGYYARLSSNGWLSVFHPLKPVTYQHHLSMSSQFIIDSDSHQDFLFFLSLDGHLYVFDIETKKSWTVKIPLQSIPTFLKIRKKFENPEVFRLLVGGASETNVYDAKIDSEGRLSIKTYRTFSFSSQKGVFMGGLDSYAFVSEDNKVRLFCSQCALKEFQKKTEFTTQLQFVEPYLLFNDESSVWVMNTNKEIF